MKQSIIWAIVVIVVIIAGLWFFAGANRGQVQEEEQAAEPTTAQTTSPTPTPSPEVRAAATHTLNVESSQLNWQAERVVGNGHTGTVSFKSGNVTMENGAITAGEFVVDMTSITESQNNQRFLTHLQSDDFFAVAEYPEAMFVLTGATEDAWSGNLTIRDQVVAVDVPVTVTETADGLTVTSDLTLDRTEWGINFDSGSIFTELGDRAIEDEIELDASLNLEAV